MICRCIVTPACFNDHQSRDRVVREQVAQALDVLAEGMQPFIENGLKAIYQDNWEKTAAASFRGGRGHDADSDATNWDAHAVLTVLWDQWNSVFRHHLSPLERSLVGELREFRNRWAHQDEFEFEDEYRVYDSVHRLLAAAGSDKAEEIGRKKRDLMRHRFSVELDQSRQKKIADRKKLRDLILLPICCTATVSALIIGFERDGWILSVFVIIAFIYMMTQRIFTQTTVWYSARECPLCGRVIYGATCPYCEESQKK